MGTKSNIWCFSSLSLLPLVGVCLLSTQLIPGRVTYKRSTAQTSSCPNSNTSMSLTVGLELWYWRVLQLHLLQFNLLPRSAHEVAFAYRNVFATSTDRWTHRQTDRHAEILTVAQTDTQKDWQSDKHAERLAVRQTHRRTYKHTQKDWRSDRQASRPVPYTIRSKSTHAVARYMWDVWCQSTTWCV